MKTICTVIILAFALCTTGCRDEVARRNYENLKRVSYGMHWRDAYAIMGEYQYCDTVSWRKSPGEDGIPKDEFVYRAPFGASGDFSIFVAVKDSIVIGVYRGE